MMQHAGYHHAKMLAEHLRDMINTQGIEMLAILQELVIGDDNPHIEVISPPTSPPAPAANTVAHTYVQPEMLRILQEM